MGPNWVTTRLVTGVPGQPPARAGKRIMVATAPNIQTTEFEDFAFSLRYPQKGRAKGDGTIRAYLYTVDRFLN